MEEGWILYYYHIEGIAKYVFEQYKSAGAPVMLLGLVWGDEAFLLHRAFVVAALGSTELHGTIDPANPYERSDDGEQLLELLEYAEIIDYANMPVTRDQITSWAKSTIARGGE